VKAIIIGPPDTPYEFGFFEVCFSLWRTINEADVPSVFGQVRQRYDLSTASIYDNWLKKWF
jgi:hypothetical protein